MTETKKNPGGRPRKGKALRVPITLSGTPATIKTFMTFRDDLSRKVPGASFGDTLDWLVRIAGEQGISPRTHF
jgi:hypothetical protein